MCLFNDVNRKQDIIKVVWYENHKSISDNNYHQLIHKFRVHLKMQVFQMVLLKPLIDMG